MYVELPYRDSRYTLKLSNEATRPVDITERYSNGDVLDSITKAIYSKKSKITSTPNYAVQKI